MYGEQSFGQWLKQLRRERDLTQPALAARAHCSAETLRKVEAGIARPSQDLARALAAGLDLPEGERSVFVQWARAPAGTPPPSDPHPDPALTPLPLPIPPTPLIGRDQERADAAALLARPEVRLLVLTGPAGVGKTRLALQLAADLRGSFADGTCYVSLAALHDSTLLGPALAHALGVRESADQGVLARVVAHLAARHLLLVLDNFEQLLPAAPHVGDLLAAAPRLKLLVTSRIVLPLRGAYHLPVPPLALPAPNAATTLDTLAQSTAVRLFLTRAQAADPTFTLTPENAAAVGAICARLDGLPLAIELAAARIRHLPPQALLDQLGAPFQLLTGGAWDLAAHQQTLRGALDWSYDLLPPDAQELFRRLAVFAAGCTLDGARYVCRPAAEGSQGTLSGLAALLDQSLLRQDPDLDGAPRFRMLELIREYAWERLLASDEAGAVRGRHAAYYLACVEAVNLEDGGAEQRRLLDYLEQEHDNLRAALAWAQDEPDPTTFGRLCGALWWFWWIRGYLSEGRRWLATALDRRAGLPPDLLARLLLGAGVLAARLAEAEQFYRESLALSLETGNRQRVLALLNNLGYIALQRGDYGEAVRRLEEGLVLERALNHPRVRAHLLSNLADVALQQGDYDQAQRLAEECLVLRRERKDTHGIAYALMCLGDVAQGQGDYAQAAARYVEALALCRRLAHSEGIAAVLCRQGEVAYAQGDLTRAAGLWTQSLALYRQVGEKMGQARVLYQQGRLAGRQGSHNLARQRLEASLSLCRELGLRPGTADCLDDLAVLADAQGQAARAARLWAAAAAWRAASGSRRAVRQRAWYDEVVAAARTRTPAPEWSDAWAAGHAWRLEDAVAEVLGVEVE